MGNGWSPVRGSGLLDSNRIGEPERIAGRNVYQPMAHHKCIKDAIWTYGNLLVGKHMQVSLNATQQLAKFRLKEYAACCHSNMGARVSQEKVPAATSPDCPVDAPVVSGTAVPWFKRIPVFLFLGG